MVNYKDIELKDKPVFDYFFSLRQFENSEFTFTNLFIWRHSYSLKFAIIDDYLCIMGRYKNRYPVLFPPLGKDTNQFGDVFTIVIDDFKNKGYPVIVKSITQPIKELIENSLPGIFYFEPDLNNSDYVYLSYDLINLKGRKLHRKRNHINKFISKYDYTYEEIDSNNIDECIVAEYEWLNKNEPDDELLDEKAAIIEAFRNYETLKLKGGALRIDNKVQAFTIGELLNPQMAVIHIEKANTDYDGCFAMINQQFVRHCWADVKYINREEDMGIPGLRKAKESYYPVKKIIKYTGFLESERG